MLSLSKHKCSFPPQTSHHKSPGMTALQSPACLNSGSTLSWAKATHPGYLWLLSLSHPTCNPSRNAVMLCLQNASECDALTLPGHTQSQQLWSCWITDCPPPDLRGSILPFHCCLCSRNTWPVNRASNTIACDSKAKGWVEEDTYSKYLALWDPTYSTFINGQRGICNDGGEKTGYIGVDGQEERRPYSTCQTLPFTFMHTILLLNLLPIFLSPLAFPRDDDLFISLIPFPHPESRRFCLSAHCSLPSAWSAP